MNQLAPREFSEIKYAAKRRKIKFDITLQYVRDLFKQQKGRCAYTQQKLSFIKGRRQSRTDSNASLDRIDSSKGYEEGNVQWVRKNVNLMKNELSHSEFVKICGLIWKNRNKNVIAGSIKT